MFIYYLFCICYFVLISYLTIRFYKFVIKRVKSTDQFRSNVLWRLLEIDEEVDLLSCKLEELGSKGSDKK